jgi:cell division septum initiation protein DivIVA
MTKKQELAWLDSLIVTLGPDSYLGPWLSSVKANVEQMIQSDIFPDIVPSETAATLAKQKEDCKKECADMISRAEFQAKRITDAATEFRDRTRAVVRRQLEEAIKTVS